jgi:MoaA/NifB/PqqE/SkfB family radical SAM enzyme
MEHFEILLNQLPSTVKSLIWGGMGETLLNSNTVAMIKEAHNKGYKTTLYTNGTILHGELQGYLDEVVYNTDTLIEENVIFANQVSANFVLKNSIEDLLTFINRTTIKNITVTPIRQMYPGADIHRQKLYRTDLGPDEQKKIIGYASQRGKKIDFAPILSWKNCVLPWFQVNISHDLQVTPCCVNAHPLFFSLGQIGKMNLDDIWKGEKYRQFRHSFTSHRPLPICQQCGVF